MSTGNGRNARRSLTMGACALLWCSGFSSDAGAEPQAPHKVSQAADLATMSLEELLKVEVTSVSRRPEFLKMVSRF